MLVGLVIIFALLSAGFGYAALLHSATAGGGVWEFAFVASALLFLFLFTRLIVAKAAGSMMASYPGRSGARAKKRQPHPVVTMNPDSPSSHTQPTPDAEDEDGIRLSSETGGHRNQHSRPRGGSERTSES